MADFRDKARLGRALCKRATPKAIKVYLEDLDAERWVPQSQIDDESEVWKEGDDGELVVNGWFADQEGLR